MTMPTRFSGLRPLAARAVLALLAAFVLAGLVLSARPIPAGEYMRDDPNRADSALYRAVAGRVKAGEGYYDAVVAEQRARGYPLRPVFTVRLPTLATLVALGGPAATYLLGLIAVLATASLAARLAPFATGRWQLGFAFLCAGLGSLTLVDPDTVVWHEVWAGLLIAASLGCRTDRRWAGSVLLAAAAVAIRELAVPFAFAMAAVAALEGRRREALAWAGLLLAFAAGFAWHASEVAARASPADLASPGWTSFGGWRLVLTMVQLTSPLGVAPLSLAAFVVPLALLGWLAWPGSTGSRGALVLCGYAATFTVVGRANNIYWGLLMTPLLFAGLFLAPAALRDLAAAAGLSRRTAPAPAAKGPALAPDDTVFATNGPALASEDPTFATKGPAFATKGPAFKPLR